MVAVYQEIKREKKRPFLVPTGWLTAREEVWKAIRAYGHAGQGFTRRQICCKAIVTNEVAREYLIALTEAGYLRRDPADTTRRDWPPAVYHLIRDCGIEAPLLQAQRRGPSVQQLVWSAIKALPVFDAMDVVTATGAHREAVRAYLKRLSAAGYLAIVKPSIPGTLAVWKLRASMNTGPKAPAVRRDKTIFDFNLGRAVSAVEVSHEK